MRGEKKQACLFQLCPVYFEYITSSNLKQPLEEVLLRFKEMKPLARGYLTSS